MESKEAIKRLRQETCPATYMPDFDKEECLQVIEKDLDRLEKLEKAFELLMKRYGFRVYETKDFEGNEHKHFTTGLLDGYFTLSQDEYDLLREVLRNAKKD